MVLKIRLDKQLQQQIYDLIQKYEAKGIIKEYEIKNFGDDFDDDFEWMKKQSISNMDELL